MKGYTFIDYATQAYLGFVAILILCFHNASVPEWPYLVAAHAGGLLAVHGLVRAYAARPDARSLDFFRHFYPILLYTAFYRETGALNQMFVADYQDPAVIRVEQWLFGFQPSLAFMDRVPWLPVSELFYMSYFSYYVMIAGVGLALFLRNRAQFFHYVSLVSFVFYVCYTVYIFLPVMGPRVFFREIEGYSLPADLESLAGTSNYPAAVKSGLFFQIMGFIYRSFEAPGAAFPSSHVAVAISTAFFSYLYLPRIRHLHAVVVVLLCMATVYCRYHYVVDVVAGAVTAAVLIPLGNRLIARFGGTSIPPPCKGM